MRADPLQLTNAIGWPGALRGSVWLADAVSSDEKQPIVSSGFSALDAVLPGGGWPLGHLIEVLQPQGMHAEWRMTSPACEQLLGAGWPLILIAPPWSPGLQGLQLEGIPCSQVVWVNTQDRQECLWATEQALMTEAPCVVMTWLGQCEASFLRRLQVKATQNAGLLMVWRPISAQATASPAPLRLSVSLGSTGHSSLSVHVFKRRGSALANPIDIQPLPAGIAPLIRPPKIQHPDVQREYVLLDSIDSEAAIRRTAALQFG